MEVDAQGVESKEPPVRLKREGKKGGEVKAAKAGIGLAVKEEVQGTVVGAVKGDGVINNEVGVKVGEVEKDYSPRYCGQGEKF